MPIQNRKSYSMSPGSKSSPRPSSPRPSSPRPSSPKPAYRPPVRVSTGPKESFGSPRKEAGFQQPSPAFRETRPGYPGYRRPFYRHPASIISFIVFILACLACLALVAIFWVVPSLMNGSLHF